MPSPLISFRVSFELFSAVKSACFPGESVSEAFRRLVSTSLNMSQTFPIRSPRRPKSLTSISSPALESRVYFLQCTVTKAIKIGVTTNVRNRISNIQSSTPFPLLLLLTFDGDCDIELEVHRRFIKTRPHSEWFVPTDDLLAYIDCLRENDNIHRQDSSFDDLPLFSVRS